MAAICLGVISAMAIPTADGASLRQAAPISSPPADGRLPIAISGHGLTLPPAFRALPVSLDEELSDPASQRLMKQLRALSQAADKGSPSNIDERNSVLRRLLDHLRSRHGETAISSLSFGALLTTGYVQVRAYDQAIGLFQELLPASIERFGDKSLVVARLRYRFGQTFYLNGNADDAIRMASSALPIARGLAAPDDPLVEDLIVLIAGSHRRAGRLDEAVRWLETAPSVAGSANPEDGIPSARAMRLLALALADLKRYGESADVWFRVVGIERRGGDANAYLRAADQLGSSLTGAGRYREAARALQEAIDAVPLTDGTAEIHASLWRRLANAHHRIGETARAIEILTAAHDRIEKTGARDTPAHGELMNFFSIVLAGVDRSREAKRLVERVLRIRTANADRTTPGIVIARMNLATISGDLGQFEDAIRELTTAYALIDELAVYDHTIAGTIKTNLSSLYLRLGDPARSEQAARTGLRHWTAALGPDSPNTLSALTSLAAALDAQGRYTEARALHRKALRIVEDDPLRDLDDAVSVLKNAAVNLLELGEFEPAAEMVNRIARIAEQRGLGADEDLAWAWLNLSRGALRNGRPAQAIELAGTALKAARRLYPRGDLRLLEYLILVGETLAFLHLNPDLVDADTGRLASRALTEARELLKTSPIQSVESWSRILHAEAILELLTDNPSAALKSALEAFEVQRDTVRRIGLPAIGSIGQRALTNVGASAMYATLAAWDLRATGDRILLDGVELSPKELAFETVQQLDVPAAANAAVLSAARIAAETAGLSDAVASIETINREIAALDAEFVSLVGRVGADTGPERERIEERLSRLKSDRKQAERSIREAYPDFYDLIHPTPLRFGELRRQVSGGSPLLGEDEALVIVRAGLLRRPGFVFVATRDRLEWARLELPEKELERHLADLRRSVDSGGQTRIPRLGDRDRSANGYDRSAAHALYNALFGAPGIRDALDGKRNWIIVPDDTLIALPFAALVTAPPEGHDADPRALRRTSWLGLERGISILPSASTLRAIRQRPPPARGNDGLPFFGIGAPRFGDGDHAGDTASSPTAASVREIRLDALRALTPLSGTRREVETVAGIFGTDGRGYLLDADATEANLKRAAGDGALANAEVVLFATHGVVSGGIPGLSEPALALSVPPAGSTEDGWFTATEASLLRLRADWVILSACNTASDGLPKAGGLSALVRAFFYAGASAVVATQWRVYDDAAVELTTRALRSWRAGVPRTAAIRSAMRDVISLEDGDDRGHSYAHPSFWAPFTLLGVDELR